ncbi:MAG: substrate-binding domain-containing protein, partial [Bacteroidota bacterium]
FLKREGEHFLGYVGQDSFQSGVLAARLLDFGIDNGDAVMILHLEKGVYNSQHLIEKEEGFHQYFVARLNRNIQVIKTSFENPADTTAFRKFIKHQLQSYPQLKGIFVTTSKLYHLAGVLEKLKIEKLKLVGFDLVDENLHYLRDGKIDFLINQNPVRQGYLGIMNIFDRLVNDKPVEAIQHLPLHVIMKENVNYYLEDKMVVPTLL